MTQIQTIEHAFTFEQLGDAALDMVAGGGGPDGGATGTSTTTTTKTETTIDVKGNVEASVPAGPATIKGGAEAEYKKVQSTESTQSQCICPCSDGWKGVPYL